MLKHFSVKIFTKYYVKRCSVKKYCVKQFSVKNLQNIMLKHFGVKK